jgi:hydrogenase/urease accessory protein HupE
VSRCRALALLVACVALFFGRAAHAHAVGVSSGDYVVVGKVVSARTTFARTELASMSASTPAGNDATSSIVLGIVVRADGALCTGALVSATPTESDGLDVRAKYTCSAVPAKVSIELRLLDDLSHGHRHVAQASAGAARAGDVLFRGHSSFEIDVPAASTARASSEEHASAGALSFFRMGIEHILTGYDHLLFLFGLILVGGRVRALIAVVTAFTVAHSITLALAVLGVWAPRAGIVEPLIALSIVYVGVENFFVKNAEKRWRLTFPFGLIHGFGFAGALREIDLPHAKIPVALVGFNLGVEAGQLAVLAVLLPAVLWLRTKPAFAGRGVQIVSGCVVAAGVIWFVQRAFGV